MDNNIPFTVGAAGDKVTFTYDPVTHILTIEVTAAPLPVDPVTLVREPVRHPIQNDVFSLRHARPLRERRPGQ